MKRLLLIVSAVICGCVPGSSNQRDIYLHELASVIVDEPSLHKATLPDAIETIEVKWKELTGKELSIAVVNRTNENKESNDITISVRDLPFLEMLTYICEMSATSLKLFNDQLFIEDINFSGQCNCRGQRLVYFDWNESFASTLGIPFGSKETEIHDFLSDSGIRMDFIRITYQPDFKKLFIAGEPTDISDIHHLIRLRENGFEIKKLQSER